MRWHVISPFVGVDEIGLIFGYKLVEIVVQIRSRRWVRILHNDERTTGVLDKNRRGTGGYPTFPNEIDNLIRDFISPLPVGADGESFAKGFQNVSPKTNSVHANWHHPGLFSHGNRFRLDDSSVHFGKNLERSPVSPRNRKKEHRHFKNEMSILTSTKRTSDNGPFAGDEFVARERRIISIDMVLNMESKFNGGADFECLTRFEHDTLIIDLQNPQHGGTDLAMVIGTATFMWSVVGFHTYVGFEVWQLPYANERSLAVNALKPLKPIERTPKAA